MTLVGARIASVGAKSVAITVEVAAPPRDPRPHDLAQDINSRYLMKGWCPTHYVISISRSFPSRVGFRVWAHKHRLRRPLRAKAAEAVGRTCMSRSVDEGDTILLCYHVLFPWFAP
jgi:hypothetical protein